MRSSQLLLLATFLAAAPPPVATAQRAAGDREEGEEIDRRGGNGSIPLGATAKGMIVQGFYNTVSFEAVRGTTVTCELQTFHKSARPIAELLRPDRTVLATFAATEGDARRLVLTAQTLEATGSYTIRFGFLKEENGRYVLRTDGSYPKSATHEVTVPAGGEAIVPIEGMLGRKLARCEFLLPEGADVSVSLVHEHGFEEDLTRHTRRTTFGRRVKITNVPIDSNKPLELILKDEGGAGAAFTVEVEYANPPLTRKRIKI